MPDPPARIRLALLALLATAAVAALAFLPLKDLIGDLLQSVQGTGPLGAAIDRAVERRGFKIVLLTRLSPVFPFNFLNYAYGVTPVSFRDYLLASWIGMLPGTLLYVYLGSAVKSVADVLAGNVEGGVEQKIFFGAGLVVTVAVTIYVTRIARNALREAAPEGART
jgi:uncharacterized membrane protein YdjX (TVP38/TMEM64 family)